MTAKWTTLNKRAGSRNLYIDAIVYGTLLLTIYYITWSMIINSEYNLVIMSYYWKISFK